MIVAASVFLSEKSATHTSFTVAWAAPNDIDIKSMTIRRINVTISFIAKDRFRIKGIIGYYLSNLTSRDSYNTVELEEPHAVTGYRYINNSIHTQNSVSRAS